METKCVRMVSVSLGIVAVPHPPLPHPLVMEITLEAVVTQRDLSWGILHLIWLLGYNQ